MHHNRGAFCSARCLHTEALRVILSPRGRPPSQLRCDAAYPLPTTHYRLPTTDYRLPTFAAKASKSGPGREECTAKAAHSAQHGAACEALRIISPSTSLFAMPLGRERWAAPAYLPTLLWPPT